MTEFFYGMTLADQIDGFRKDRQRLAEENAKLRRENAELLDEIEHLLIKRQLIEDTNTELRELCADMWEAVKTHKRINFAQLLRFGERVHELRVEVDG